jgi:uncharacterized protein involved in exopolysaccharide biosynthesis
MDPLNNDTNGRALVYVHNGSSAVSKDHPPLTLRDFLTVGFRRKRLLLTSFFTIVLLAVLYPFVLPNYESETKILVKHERPPDPVGVSTDARPIFSPDNVTEEELNSEIELINSKDLLRQVVIACDLQHPKTWMGRTLATIRRTLKAAVGITETEDDRIYKTADRLFRVINIEPVDKSNIIDITYGAADGKLSARVLKTIDDLYLAKHLAVHRPPGQLQFFDQEAAKYQKELMDAEAKLSAFDQGGAVGPEPEVQLTSQGGHLAKLSDFREALAQTRASIAETEHRIHSLEQQVTTTPSRQTTALRRADNPELLQSLKATLLGLEIKRSELLAKFEPTYRPVVEVEKEIAEAQAAIAAAEANPMRDETTDVNPAQQWVLVELEKAKSELRTLEGRATAMNKIVQSYDETARKLGEQSILERDLQRAQKVSEQNYLLYVQKREEARISDALDARRILNVSIAQPPTLPLLPKHSPLLYAVAGVFLAGVVSIGLVTGVEAMDNSFRTPYEVESYLQIPVLAAVPVTNLSAGNPIVVDALDSSRQ